MVELVELSKNVEDSEKREALQDIDAVSRIKSAIDANNKKAKAIMKKLHGILGDIYKDIEQTVNAVKGKSIRADRQKTPAE